MLNSSVHCAQNTIISDLNKKIDNISGASLSVNSMDRMARAALILDNVVNDNKC